MIAVLLAATLSQAAPTPVVTPPPSDEVAPVVVTGTRSKAARRELEACLARKCPPGEDMRASLRSVNESFLAGDYERARKTVAAAIGRNRRFADRHPVLLAGLHKAEVTVTKHMGRGANAARSVEAVAPLLARRYGVKSPEVLWARLEAADTFAAAKQLIEAREIYLALQTDARAAGDTALERAVEVRLAWEPAIRGRPGLARRNLQALIDRAEPDDPQQKLAARILQLKLLRGADRDKAAAKLIAEVEGRTPTPMLLWSPPLALRPSETPAGLLPGQRPSRVIADQSEWVDVGFWINSAGRVEAPEILRGLPSDASWHRHVLDGVGRRIYSPPASGGSAADDRLYRVERLALATLVTIEKVGSRYGYGARRVTPQLHATSLIRDPAPGEKPNTP